MGGWPFNIDIDSEGNVIGLEIMDASTVLSHDYISKLTRIDKQGRGEPVGLD